MRPRDPNIGADRAHALIVDPEITMTVRSSFFGREFLVRVVRTGERYGLNDCLRNDGETMVEFYDLTYANDGTEHEYAFGPRGQFVSRYYLSTLCEVEGGLCLDGGNATVWSLDADAVTAARDFALSKTWAEL